MGLHPAVNKKGRKDKSESMSMDRRTPLSRYLSKLGSARHSKSGDGLSELLCVDGGSTMRHLDEMIQDMEFDDQIRAKLGSPWDLVVTSHLNASHCLKSRDFIGAFDYQVSTINAFIRTLPQNDNWVLLGLYTLNQDLYDLAIASDEQLLKKNFEPTKLEESARIINKSFSACINDREDIISRSRKWGTYYMANLLFKVYFRIRSLNLCGNVLKAIKASQPPEIEQFPLGDQVTFNFYLGVLSFRGEEYEKASDHLEFSLKHCYSGAKANKRAVLEYLIPIKMLNGILPSEKLFNLYPDLRKIYGIFANAIKSGDVGMFDRCLEKHQRSLLRRGTYMIMEHIREMVIRTLYLIKGSNSRLSLDNLKQALRVAGLDIEMAEIECLVVNMIYKGYIKGYLSHEHLILVLSKQDPFPVLGNKP
ncbi:COP9 signalosome (CSN) subunit [Mycoemilia scoparia]|uniref:COP9 signalosome (CSN) subunit n=1 Tax=Mycoemilia scoparia TaxID=417184 RepID=A0A9W8A6J5_9FUNG|nr:COP9 signalosome (CSN) subunit [Mycoemilia scoparia]